MNANERRAEFRVYGIPAPQGSKMAFVAGGRARMKEASGQRLVSWRNAVSAAASVERERLGRALDGPLRVDMVFRFPMPASRPKRVRALCSVPKTTAPDLSKLIRSTEDALTAAGLIADDARIVSTSATKYEIADDWTGAVIYVAEIGL